jgi:hypothetical protein
VKGRMFASEHGEKRVRIWYAGTILRWGWDFDG